MDSDVPGAAPSSAEPSGQGNPTFQLQELLESVLHYKWLVLACTVVAVAGQAWYLSRLRPQYQARATMVIEPAAPKVLTNVNEVSELGMSSDEEHYYATQHRILGSESLVAEAIVRLAQVNAASMAKATPAGIESKPPPATTATTPDHDLIERTQGKIRIAPVNGTQLVHINVTDYDPQQAALLANTLGDVYIERNLSQKTEASRTALSWLEAQSEQLQEKLRDSEMALNRFKRDNNVLSMALEDRQNILAADLGALSSALSNTRIKRMDLAAQVAELEAAVKFPGGERTLTLANNNEDINLLLKRRKQLQLDATQIEARYLPDHPKAVEARMELEKVENLIAKEVPITLGILNRELGAVKRFEADLQARLEKTKGVALDLNGREADYNRIQREYETNKNLYSLVLTRSKETNLTRRLETNNVRMLDRAHVPRVAIGAKRATTMAVGFATGLVLGIVLALGLGQLDQSVKSQDDVTVRAGLPFLGVIPSLMADVRPGRKRDPIDSDDQALRVHTHPTSLTAETCRAIRSNLLFTSPDAPLRTIAVTSPEHADGKTSTAVKLAVVLSQTQGKTLIIDADMRRPRLQEIFGVPNQTGLSTIMSGECTINDAIKRTEIPNVDVLTSGRIPPNAAELLHSRRFASLLVELRDRYSMIVFDTPPVLAVTDAVVLGTQVDGIVAVARWRRTNRHSLRDACVQLKEVGCRVLGVVLNDLNPRKGAYYYRYRSYGRYGLPTTGKARA